MKVRTKLGAVVAAVGIGMGAGACAPAQRASAAPVAALPTPSPHAAGTLAAIAGRSWVLREWRTGEGFEGHPAVTLRYAESRIAGRSGCNRYTADAKPGTATGELVLSPIAATRMMCPRPAMAVEKRFLAALERAKRWSVLASGDLAVVYASDSGGEATLLFSEVTTHRSD